MIRSLRLQQFRSYTDMTFDFGEGANIIVGPNGSGKTNLLEAILVVARGGSYRASDVDLLQFGAAWFRLDAVTIPEDSIRTVKLVTEPRLVKTYELDGKKYQRLHMNHVLPAVLFEPNHLFLLHGAPANRREYLDDILEQVKPSYGGLRRNYRRVLAQRNALLKRSKLPTTQELFPWNLRLSELGAAVARARLELCERLHKSLGITYKEISETTTDVAIVYCSKFPVDSYETHLLQKLESHAQEDAVRGFTAYGPHREDFTVTFDGRAANETASRGETRTAMLALKIIELQLLEAVRDQTPLLLLDDVFSELDMSRRIALSNFIGTYQTFITTTDADTATQSLVNKAIIIRTR
ncbi:MAG TPA: DNA replication and repair protein RecF [Verrucomicrobiae bacterium]|nr:DNA replication and repair protein RecF [Verrucomicrobiae bacterium]